MYPNRKNNTEDVPIYISYQNPLRVCFTRNVTYEKDFPLDRDHVTLDATKIVESELILYILFHQKGRMLNEASEGSYILLKPKEVQDTISREKNGSIYHIELKMNQMEVLRKRPDADPPCDGSLHDEDRKLIHIAIKEKGCVPTFWERFATHEELETLNKCQTQEQLRKMTKLLWHYKHVSKLIQPLCQETTITTMLNKRAAATNDGRHQLVASFFYTKEKYKEITNTKAFQEEDLLSMCGGYVGIFLGYSLFQLASIAENFVSLVVRTCRQERVATAMGAGVAEA